MQEFLGVDQDARMSRPEVVKVSITCNLPSLISFQISVVGIRGVQESGLEIHRGPVEFKLGAMIAGCMGICQGQ